MSFEGSEKKLEITLVPGLPSLRELPVTFWEELVGACQATILSSVSNSQTSAYVLSESSLFVWDRRLVMITCGQTQLINSFLAFTEKFQKEDFESLIFQRKNEYFSHLQRSSFEDDRRTFQRFFKGHAYQFGQLDAHHNLLFHLDKKINPSSDDCTSELLMYHLGGEAAELFRSPDASLDRVRSFLKLDELFSGFEFDDHLFRPMGYSLNGIKDDRYITFHVTPEERTSYVSFETNIVLDSHPQLFSKVIDIFSPESFDIVHFSQTAIPGLPKDFVSVAAIDEQLECGYPLQFRQYMRKKLDSDKAFRF